MSKSRFVPPIVVADEHDFVGRVFDLAMPLELGFTSNKQLSQFPDCLYVMRAYWRLNFLIQRAESLNIVRKMLLARRLPKSFADFPLTRYEWLTVAADVFLMRFVSVFDCCMLLTNEVFECGIEPHVCSVEKLRKKGVPQSSLDSLIAIRTTDASHRNERNWRFHRGEERAFTKWDAIFRAMSTFETIGGIRPIIDSRTKQQSDVTHWFSTALTKLRRECTFASLKLASGLPDLYGELGVEFEKRFKSKLKARRKPLPWYPNPTK